MSEASGPAGAGRCLVAIPVHPRPGCLARLRGEALDGLQRQRTAAPAGLASSNAESPYGGGSYPTASVRRRFVAPTKDRRRDLRRGWADGVAATCRKALLPAIE